MGCSNVQEGSAFSGAGKGDPEEGKFGEIVIGDFKNDPCGRKNALRDVVFILDSTSSVSNDNWMHFISIAKNIATTFHPSYTKISVLEFGNTRTKTLDKSVGDGTIHFLAGTPTAFSLGLSAMNSISISSRKIREASYDGVGPAILKAKEYLSRVGRSGATKEIWAIHDMSCCGFPANGETGSQIQDAQVAKSAGITVVGIRTLRSTTISDQIASPGLAFDLGASITNVADTVLANIATSVSTSVCNK